MFAYISWLLNHHNYHHHYRVSVITRRGFLRLPKSHHHHHDFHYSWTPASLFYLPAFFSSPHCTTPSPPTPPSPHGPHSDCLGLLPNSSNTGRSYSFWRDGESSSSLCLCRVSHRAIFVTRYNQFHKPNLGSCLKMGQHSIFVIIKKQYT